MLCPRCGTIFEGRFCHACGFDAQAPSYICPRCGGWFSGYACPYCGLPVGAVPYPPPPEKGASLRAVGTVFWSMAMVLFLVLLVFELATLAYTAGLVINGSLASGPRIIPLYVLAPFPEGNPYDATAAVFIAYYLLLVAAIVASYLYYLVSDGRLTVRTFARPIAELGPRLASRSALLATGQVFLAVFTFQGIYLLALWLVGFEPTLPTNGTMAPSWYEYFALANASVYEEVVTRWLYIGVPLFFVAALLSHDESERAAALGKKPVPIWRHLIGGTITRDSSPAMIVASGLLLVVSSVVFGLAHVPSWGWWKFPPTFVAGLALGYLFLRSGLLAAILLHFATDYLAAMAILTDTNLGAQILLGLFILVAMGLGVLFFIWYFEYAARLFEHFANAWRPKPVPTMAVAAPTSAAPPIMPAHPSTPPPPIPHGSGTWFGGFTCPRCGWREARYADGRLSCLRCGQVT